MANFAVNNHSFQQKETQKWFVQLHVEITAQSDESVLLNSYLEWTEVGVALEAWLGNVELEGVVAEAEFSVTLGEV